MARSPIPKAFEALDEALATVRALARSPTSEPAAKLIRQGLERFAGEVEAARLAADKIAMPRQVFDPADPKIVGRMVSIALLAQPRVPLASVNPTYGSGVYAIYYAGSHPLYSAISGTETPIYVGKADPDSGDASTSREQGARLTGRLIEHAGTVAVAEKYARDSGLSAGLHPISLADFTCRRLVCATNAQLVAERHLIGMFWPLWNSDTKACWGFSKHGDSAKTRANKRSPWDVMHPGRPWALDSGLADKMTPTEIAAKVATVLAKVPPRLNHATLMDEMLESFQQGAIATDEAAPPLDTDDGPDPDEAGGADEQG